MLLHIASRQPQEGDVEVGRPSAGRLPLFGIFLGFKDTLLPKLINESVV